MWKRTSNSHNISSFWTCLRLVNVWEHIKSLAENMWIAEIIREVTIALSINSNKDFDFCWLSYQNSLSILFSQCEVSLCERNTHDVSSLLTLVKIVVASQYRKQRNKALSRFVDNLKHRLGLESAGAALCKWATRTRQTFLSKTFANSPNEKK